jgi:hypothetical protein
MMKSLYEMRIRFCREVSNVYETLAPGPALVYSGVCLLRHQLLRVRLFFIK